TGPGGRIGLELGLGDPGDGGGRVFGRIVGGFAALDREETQIIGGFAPGQLPTYIDITGRNGFAFNNNSIVHAEIDVTRYRLEGEAGWEKQINPNVSVSPVFGIRSQRIEYDYNVFLDTDFGNGRFFNTLDESLRLNQVGAALGLDATVIPRKGITMSIGGYAGLAVTDASYTGSDCGDGSILTAGCDGALFSNTGISRDRNSLDAFGGLEASIGIYLFCRGGSTKQIAPEALKDQCVHASARGNVDFMPTTEIDRPTTLGGPGVTLSTTHVTSSAFSLRARVPLN
ncbi:MAG: hypothetical protein AAGF59_15085, partial [Pseudomonadota bacterium]